MKAKKTNSYILFWLSQAISGLGSSMTSFALIIWAYTQTGSAMTVSLLTFFYYLPYILVSILAGSFVDKHKKKPIMLWTDLASYICTMAVLLLLTLGRLEIWNIYIVNGIIGVMNAFQSPASTVAVGMLVPKEKYEKVSGMNSFSNSLITIVTPMLAAFVSSFGGLVGVLLIDILSFSIAFITLLFFIKIPEANEKEGRIKKQNLLDGCKDGFLFLRENKGLQYLMFSMALMNFFSRLTYENILPAMILSRSGGNNNVLGLVSGIIGVGGILGAMVISLIQLPKDKMKLIYYSAAFSFLFGDLLMGIGQNRYIWSMAALAASVPVPFITAGQSVILYESIPVEMQGRIFALRNAFQYFTISIAILLGGALADYVFEPFMQSTMKISLLLQKVVGAGDGSGMAVMFLCTGILGFFTSIILYKKQSNEPFIK